MLQYDRLGFGFVVFPTKHEWRGILTSDFTVQTVVISRMQAAAHGIDFVSTPRIRQLIKRKRFTSGKMIGNYILRFNHNRRTLEWLDYNPFLYAKTRPKPRGLSEEIDWRLERMIRKRVGTIRFSRHTGMSYAREDQLRNRKLSEGAIKGNEYSYRKGRRLLLTRVRANRKRFPMH